MRKLAMLVGHDVHAEHRKSKVPLCLFIFFLTTGLLPLAIEGASICLSNWKEVMGINSKVRTPVLDNLQVNLDNMKDLFWDQITPFFRRVPWDPKMVLPAAGVVMAVAMLMLRR
jgi:hypothetical protein